MPAAKPKIEIPDVVEGEPEKKKLAKIDIDAMIAEEMAEARAEANEIKGRVDLFDREWDLVEPSNDFNNIAASNFAEEPHRLLNIMVDLVHPDQRSDFQKVLARLPAIKTKTILTIFQAMTEAVAGRPTEPSSPSRRGRVTPRSTKS